MRHQASAAFWRAYDGLPEPIRKLADKNFALLKSDPSHPSCISRRWAAFYSARVGLRYRALAFESDHALVWFWIGSHADYDALLRLR